MQVLKGDIRRRILDVAGQQFARQGYAKTSMREVAARADIAVGNLYHYFPGKDDLFRALLSPVLSAFDTMLQRHHGMQGEDILLMKSETYLRTCIDEYVNLINRHRDLLNILLFQAQGSSLERFREDFTNRSTEVVKSWFAQMQARHPGIHTRVPDFLIHLHTVWMFTLFEELLMHSISGQEMEDVLHDYILFEIEGWKAITRI